MYLPGQYPQESQFEKITLVNQDKPPYMDCWRFALAVFREETYQLHDLIEKFPPVIEPRAGDLVLHINPSNGGMEQRFQSGTMARYTEKTPLLIEANFARLDC